MFKNYFIENTISFYSKFSNKRIKFIKENIFLFDEIANFLSKLINNSKKTVFFGSGNSVITRKLDCEEIHIKEVNDFFFNEFKKKNFKLIKDENDFEKNLSSYDHIILADIEHQKYIANNLLEISQKMHNECRIIVISKSLIWSTIIDFFKKFNQSIGPQEKNYLPFSNLKKIFTDSNLDILRNEKIIFIPFHIPFLSKYLNLIFRLPILNFFCLLNITVLKKRNFEKKKNNSISIIVPCKDEENNIKIFENEIKSLNLNAEFLFGDDKSNDKTLEKLQNLQSNLQEKNIKIYNGPGICKSANVYEGIEKATGEIIAIYDADLTVSFEDLLKSKIYMENTNSDFINCSRMIIPQKKNAMKKMNFLGNIFFAQMFSVLFKTKITDTLCGTKIFYKKDWQKIKRYNSTWGAKDLWGDFDLLIGAYKNNLKISEVPVFYLARQEAETKMTNVFKNAIRMFYIVIYAFYKLRIENRN